MDHQTEIAIVGGGIGGLTTALCLEQAGFTNYKVFEQAPIFKEIGAAISLWPNALRVYKKLGLYDQISELWGEINTAYIKTSEGKILATSSPDYDLPAVCIHRAHLHEVLAKTIPSEKLLAGHRLKSFSQTGESIHLEFENGASDKTTLLIGADGINSNVRQQIINDGKPVYRGYNVWRGIAELNDIPSGYGSETWGLGQRCGIVPIKDNKFGWWVTINEDENETDEPDGTKAKLQKHFGNWHAPIPQLFESSPEIIKGKIGDRIPTKGWSKGGAVLLGDAAHPTTPNLGQGACMAIEGAYLIAQCLNRFDSHEMAFSHYEQLHFKRSSEIVKQSLQMGKMGQLENAVAAKARNAMIASMPDKLAAKMLDKYFGYDVTSVKI